MYETTVFFLFEIDPIQKWLVLMSYLNDFLKYFTHFLKDTIKVRNKKNIDRCGDWFQRIIININNVINYKKEDIKYIILFENRHAGITPHHSNRILKEQCRLHQ